MNLVVNQDQLEMSDKRILLLFTNHRVAEKLWPLIPHLADEYSVDLFTIGLMSYDTPWIGDVDERKVMVDKYSNYINKVIAGPGIKYHGDNINQDLHSFIDIDKYEYVIYDDNRQMSEYNLPPFYNKCKEAGVMVIGNSHGNEDNVNDATNISYDFRMDFSSGHSCSNDTLKDVVRANNHILVIVNFLGNRYSPFPTNFNADFIKRSGIVDISNHYGLPIKVKLKARLDDPNYKANIQYVKSLLDCEVITNTDNIDDLIAQSAVVISAPSTLAFKPIQLGIPTILIKGSGAIGCFKDYPGLVDLDKFHIFDSLTKQVQHGKYVDWLDSHLAGASSFSSCKLYIENIKKLI